MAGQAWVSSKLGLPIPSKAVLAGIDADGSAMYVGRVYHDGDCLIAKVIPSKKFAYACRNGHEISKQNFEFLCHESVRWVSSSNGQIIENALSVGTTYEGETLYIGRGTYEGSLTVGKIHPSHGCLYIPFAGREVSLKNYEALVEM
ncbi:unnamed protein product [Diamesa serratosioi]